ncbi:hypothetical protein A5669_11515 [Mycolicibacterium fortuitum]|nr:hypothetical protein A5669_11515 [Mycolicibacterium fortuitum]
MTDEWWAHIAQARGVWGMAVVASRLCFAGAAVLVMAACGSPGEDGSLGSRTAPGGPAAVAAVGGARIGAQGAGGCTPYLGENPPLEDAKNLANAWGRKAAELNGQAPPFPDVWESRWDSTYPALPPKAVATLTESSCRQAADPQRSRQILPELTQSPYLVGGAVYTAVLVCKAFWDRGEYDDMNCPDPNA